MQIRLEHITKRFGETVAVDDLSVTIRNGTLTALLGPSGCGKTTTLNMISGILPVTRGDVFFDERNVTTLPPEKRGVGLVFQNYALYPHMTVLQNICFPMELKHMPKAARLEKALALAEMVHISDYLKRKPAELSGGQQQRVAIARALAKDPNVLLLDEPLSNLDAKLRVEMREEIRRIQKEAQITTIFVTHDQEEASSISDQIVVLKEGKLKQEASGREMYEQPNCLFVADFLGSPTINKINCVYRDGNVLLRDSSASFPCKAALPIENGTELILAVRPESIVPYAADVFCSATVVERYSLGRDELMRLRIGEEQYIRGFVSGDKDILAGDSLAIGLKERGVFLFHAETGERYL